MASRGRGSGLPSKAARFSQEPCIASSCEGPHSAARFPRLLLPARPVILHAPGTKPAYRARHQGLHTRHTAYAHIGAPCAIYLGVLKFADVQRKFQQDLHHNREPEQAPSVSSMKSAEQGGRLACGCLLWWWFLQSCLSASHASHMSMCRHMQGASNW